MKLIHWQKKQYITDKIMVEYAWVQEYWKEGQIMTGSPLAVPPWQVVRAIEDNGGVVVCFENCSGMAAQIPLMR